MLADGLSKPPPSPAFTAFWATVGVLEELGAVGRGAVLCDPLLGNYCGAMEPLEAFGGAVPVSRQRQLSIQLRAGVGRGRLRDSPLAWRRKCGPVAGGAESGNGRLGPSWGAEALLGTSSGAAAGWSPLSSFVQVDFGLEQQADCSVGSSQFSCKSIFAALGPHLQASSVGTSRLVGRESILVQVDFGRFSHGAVGPLIRRVQPTSARSMIRNPTTL